MKIDRFECFTVSHTLNPRTGPSIAYSSTHAYVLVKLSDNDGRIGWGETYLMPGMHAAIDTVCASLLGRNGSLRSLREEARAAAGGLTGGGMAGSAIALALEDLWARRRDESVASAFGGPVRARARAYAASGGYIEDQHPRDTWPDELSRALDLGFTALKWRIGRYPVRDEVPLLERLRASAPPEILFMADGNAAYTFKEAVRMGRVMEELDFHWYEEPLEQAGGYVGYDRLTAALDIDVAGGEVLTTLAEARDLCQRHAVDILQPDPVICGGVAASLDVANLASTYGVRTVPHTSNSGIGIAAALQVIACLPAPTLSPASPVPLLEFGIDENPWRSALLESPHQLVDGCVPIPEAPGLGVVIDEERLRSTAAHRTEGAVGRGRRAGS